MKNPAGHFLNLSRGRLDLQCVRFTYCGSPAVDPNVNRTTIIQTYASKLCHRQLSQGGPIMYPILVVAIVAVCVVGERAFWWLRLGMRRDPATLEKVLAAMENGEFKTASGLAKDSKTRWSA